jgi:glutathione S-transferase
MSGTPMDSALVPSVCFGCARDVSVRRRKDDALWLPKHLGNVLGADAGDELVTILDEIRAESAAFRREIARRFDAIDKRFEAIDKRFDAVDARFDRVDARFATLESRIADVKADLMKWSFAFWTGAVVAIAVLAKLIK